MGCSFSRAFCTIINLRTRERERLEKREIIHQGLSVAVLLEVWGDGRGYLVLREIIRERAKKQKRKKKKKNIRERLQARQRRGGKKKKTEMESGRCGDVGIICFSESTFVGIFGNLGMFGVSSQQQTDTQERMEERQPGAGDE